jgi:hypothetical protein
MVQGASIEPSVESSHCRRDEACRCKSYCELGVLAKGYNRPDAPVTEERSLSRAKIRFSGKRFVWSMFPSVFLCADDRSRRY